MRQLWDFQALSGAFDRETAARPAALGVRIRVHSFSRDSLEVPGGRGLPSFMQFPEPVNQRGREGERGGELTPEGTCTEPAE